MFTKPTVLILALLFARNTAQDNAVKKGVSELEGNWQVLSLVHDGKPVDLGTPPMVTFAGDQITETSSKDVMRYKLDGAKKPKQIDWVGVEGRHIGEKIQGIYSLETDTLKICHSHYSEKGRPTEFESKEGSGRRLIVLKRIKS